MMNTERMGGSGAASVEPEQMEASTRTVTTPPLVPKNQFEMRGNPLIFSDDRQLPQIFVYGRESNGSGNRGIYSALSLDNGQWTDWKQIGNNVGANPVGVVRFPPNYLRLVFALGHGGSPIFTSEWFGYDPQDISGTWENWKELPTYASGQVGLKQLTVFHYYSVVNGDIRETNMMELIGVGKAGTVVRYNTLYPHTNQANWLPLGTTRMDARSILQIIRNSSGYPEVIVRGSGGRTYNVEKSDQGWGDWKLLSN